MTAIAEPLTDDDIRAAEALECAIRTLDASDTSTERDADALSRGFQAGWAGEPAVDAGTAYTIGYESARAARHEG